MTTSLSDLTRDADGGVVGKYRLRHSEPDYSGEFGGLMFRDGWTEPLTGRVLERAIVHLGHVLTCERVVTEILSTLVMAELDPGCRYFVGGGKSGVVFEVARAGCNGGMTVTPADAAALDVACSRATAARAAAMRATWGAALADAEPEMSKRKRGGKGDGLDAVRAAVAKVDQERTAAAAEQAAADEASARALKTAEVSDTMVRELVDAAGEDRKQLRDLALRAGVLTATDRWLPQTLRERIFAQVALNLARNEPALDALVLPEPTQPPAKAEETPANGDEKPTDPALPNTDPAPSTPGSTSEAKGPPLP